MRAFTKPYPWLTLCLAVITFTLMACTPKPEPPPCPIPSGHLVNEAFQTARSTLSQPQCRYQFDAVFSALMNICQGAPDLKNKELFSELLSWAKEEGIISTVRAKELYTRYFSDRFVSMPDAYKTCSYCPQMKSIMANCQDELRDKEKGLLHVCGDKDTYAKASNDLQKMQLILEATCSACAAQ
jgi:hypothetical protein